MLCHKKSKQHGDELSYAAVIENALPSDFRILRYATSMSQLIAKGYNESPPATSESCGDN